MAVVAACICGIFCPPSLSTNSGTLSVSMIGLLCHWVLRSRSGRCCPTPPFCVLVMFVWGIRAIWYRWLLLAAGGCLPVQDGCCWNSPLWISLRVLWIGSSTLALDILACACCLRYLSPGAFTSFSSVLYVGPLGLAADDIHCWNGFVYLGTSSFTGVVLFVAAICSLKFCLIAYAIEDLLEYVLDLQSASVSCGFWLVGLGFLAGSGCSVSMLVRLKDIGGSFMLQLTSMCWMETVLVSTMLMSWCRLGLLEMMCGWFTTLELLGKELCLGEGLSPNALSSCLLPFWSSWFAWLLLYAACSWLLMEAGADMSACCCLPVEGINEGTRLCEAFSPLVLSPCILLYWRCRLLLVCVAAGDVFQPGLLLCLTRLAGPLQIACDVGPLGVGLGYKACCFDAADLWDFLPSRVQSEQGVAPTATGSNEKCSD
ncbi:hypothetical protein Peur_020972 [Populus x canadensis]